MSALTPVCKCGQAITFPRGKNKARCSADSCGMRWERNEAGYWAIGLNTIIFTPIFPRVKACSVKSREEKYCNYPKAKRKRKAGRR